MLLLLTSIQIDVVEMVIAISKDYELFQKLKKLLPKLNKEDKVARINDKLCCLNLIDGSYCCKLNESFHREYDKPVQIYNTLHTWSIILYMEKNIDRPYILGRSHRRWFKNRNNDFPDYIEYNGSQEWKKRKEGGPSSVTIIGFRYLIRIRKSVFDFI